MNSSPSGQLQTIDRTVRVVEVLRDRGGAGVTEIAEKLDLSPATVYNHLSTLQANRFVVKEGKDYRLGLRFLSVGGHVRTEHGVLRHAEEKVADLAERTGERAQFLVEEHSRGIVICKKTGPNAVPADTVLGKTSRLHASAAGKAILSALPPDETEAVLERHDLIAVTANTVTDPESMMAELEEVEDRGYAFNDEESIEGLRSVGVPIVASEGDVLGALSVSGPSDRLKGDWFREDIPDTLLGAANEIELKVTYEE